MLLAPGSGEYVVNRLLYVGGYSRDFLIPRLKDVRVPIVFMYGEKDWIKGAKEVREGGYKCIIIPGVGHQQQWEDPDIFAQYIINAIEDIDLPQQ